ncbi:hypothetical protein ILUMI_18256, partial [Ignelater luminosus]
ADSDSGDAEEDFVSKSDHETDSEQETEKSVSEEKDDAAENIIWEKMRLQSEELPPEFVQTRSRPKDSSLFAFQKNCALATFVPRKYKKVLVVSTMHHDNEIDPVTNKPEIIMEYKRSRFGVDMIDKMCISSNVSRNSRRRPLTIFFDLMNIGGLNALNLYVANKNYEKIERREFLSILAKDLSKPLILKRMYMKNIPKNIRSRTFSGEIG